MSLVIHSLSIYRYQNYFSCETLLGYKSRPEQKVWKQITSTRLYVKQNLIYLTSRVHISVGLFSNRLPMMFKCGKNKKVAHEPLGECVTKQGSQVNP